MNRAKTRSAHSFSASGPAGTLVSFGGVLLALMVAACQSPEDTDPLNTGGTGGTGGVSTEPVGQMLDGPTPCTRANTICVALQIPSDMTPEPALLRFDFYDSPSVPAHPPNGFGGLFPSPDLVAGEEMHFELTDGGLSGSYWLFPLIYMPREGQFGVPAIGDYVMTSAPVELVLDGSPLNPEAPYTVRRYSAE